MKWLRLILVGGLIGLGASTFVKVSLANPNSCTVPYRQDARIKAGNNYIEAEVPQNDQQKATGLGGRSCIGSEQGMLFVFDKEGSYDFWMKDMKFSIDIVWLNEDKTVIDVAPNVSPATYPKTFTSKKPAKYVLELQTGKAQQLDITQGSPLQFSL
jgi:uncharacterized membrane protein (UPF0127 family)